MYIGLGCFRPWFGATQPANTGINPILVDCAHFKPELGQPKQNKINVKSNVVILFSGVKKGANKIKSEAVLIMEVDSECLSSRLVSSLRMSFWTPQNLNSEVFNTKLLLFSLRFCMQNIYRITHA